MYALPKCFLYVLSGEPPLLENRTFTKFEVEFSRIIKLELAFFGVELFEFVLELMVLLAVRKP